MSNDGTTHLTIGMYEKLKNPHIADKDKLVWIVDHNIPSDSPKTAASQKKMRDFAKANDIKFYEGEGVCHQVMMENHVVLVSLYLEQTAILVHMVLRCIWYRCRMYRLSVCNGYRNIMGNGSGNIKIQP